MRPGILIFLVLLPDVAFARGAYNNGSGYIVAAIFLGCILVSISMTVCKFWQRMDERLRNFLSPPAA